MAAWRFNAALQPLNGHRTLEEGTYRRLREGITSGALAPGAKLVGMRLATELGVSRITVANALKRLASEGFVMVAPHKEAIVAALSHARLEEMIAIRDALEGIVMRAAAVAITPETLSRLREANAALADAAIVNDLPRYRALEREFHVGIYEASGLPLTVALLADLWDRLEPYRGRRYNTMGLTTANHDEHAAILAALAAHDAEATVATMRAHVAGGHSKMRDALAA